MSETKQAAPHIGDTVEYRDKDLRVKAAIVTATPETIAGVDEKTGLAAPEEGHAHLTIFSFTGCVYSRHNVPMGDGPATWSIRT
jgi:hypothetical protein